MTTQPEPVRLESGLHMHWHGRRSYRSRVPAPRVLESVPELSHGPASGNMVIEGDNLQVMLSLRSQYSDSFDVVYIDPPYNRGGNDFRYSDARFRDPDAAPDDAEYVSNEDGEKHTKWLNYMAPRLVAIWNLMELDGRHWRHLHLHQRYRAGPPDDAGRRDLRRDQPHRSDRVEGLL